MANINHAGWYADTFKAWQGKVLGDKPTADQLGIIHGLGLRPGKQALACALALRDGGVSGAQIVMACGKPQLNRMRGLIAAGVVKREAVPPNGMGHTVYKLTLTPKGVAALKRAADALAAGKLAEVAKPKATKPAKPAKVTKPKAAKKVPAEKPAEAPKGDGAAQPPVTPATA